MDRATRRQEKLSLFDTPAGYDDPLGMLTGCHRRIEKKIGTLKALCAHLSAKGIDAEASTAAQSVLRYFNVAAAHHHADEEQDLFPMLEHRIVVGAERERFLLLGKQLREEHREIERVWARLRKPLEAVADGLMRTIPETDVHAFATLYARHIQAEESVFRSLIERWLGKSDLVALGRSMAERRGAPFMP
jgi:hemerythrin-like domain-containing protein